MVNSGGGTGGGRARQRHLLPAGLRACRGCGGRCGLARRRLHRAAGDRRRGRRGGNARAAPLEALDRPPGIDRAGRVMAGEPGRRPVRPDATRPRRRPRQRRLALPAYRTCSPHQIVAIRGFLSVSGNLAYRPISWRKGVPGINESFVRFGAVQYLRENAIQEHDEGNSGQDRDPPFHRARGES